MDTAPDADEHAPRLAVVQQEVLDLVHHEEREMFASARRVVPQEEADLLGNLVRPEISP